MWKDYSYKVKIGNLYLKEYKLVSNSALAEVFETKEEPIQRFNALQRAGIIPEGATIRFIRYYWDD